METFIAVKDKADGNAVMLVDVENNNLDKVKALIDDKYSCILIPTLSYPYISILTHNRSFYSSI